jgi:plastocyanin
MDMNDRRPHRLRAAGMTAVLIAAFLAAVSTGAQAAVMCGDKRATIVASPRQARIVGTDNNDVIVGNDLANVIEGRAAEDVVCGRGGDDVVKGQGGNDVVYGGAGNDRLLGGPSHDTLWGDAGDDSLLGQHGLFDFMIGGAGDDAMDGGASETNRGDAWNTADYRTASRPVDVNLARGTAIGQGHDTLANVDNVWGSAYDDTLVGSDTGNGNMMDGGRGDDVIDGNGGPGDTVMTCDATGPVTINLENQTSTGEGNDTLSNMSSAYGGIYGDTLIGDAQGQAIFASCFFFQYDHPVPAEESVDTIHARGGDDFFAGFGGDNLYDGGAGTDFGAWGEAHGPVTIDLAAGTAVTDNVDDPPSTDTIVGVENAFGSYGYSDHLTGDAGPNWMFGLGGDDHLRGGAGDDWLGGEHFFNLDDRQIDTLNGQSGFDHCTGGEHLRNCESTRPISAPVRPTSSPTHLTRMEKLSLAPGRIARMGLEIPSRVRTTQLAAQADRSRSHDRVRVVEFGYNPKTIAVPKGTRVMWKSVTTIEHDVTLRDGSWQSKELNEGDTASHIFKKRGTFRYYCSIHPFMKAKVIVESQLLG